MGWYSLADEQASIGAALVAALGLDARGGRSGADDAHLVEFRHGVGAANSIAMRACDLRQG